MDVHNQALYSDCFLSFFFFFFIYFILGFGNWNHMQWVLEREVYNTFIIMIFQQYDITA